eukprot:4211823-Pleurochrysis_carterae.AAC.2
MGVPLVRVGRDSSGNVMCVMAACETRRRTDDVLEIRVHLGRGRSIHALDDELLHVHGILLLGRERPRVQ